ncbi:hypothetical protein [Micropruina sp.]|uniref:hypothetical protein n=1 Tax=Micropruina sp. TaxID=2737536 RepID=UPI0039E6B8DF
MADITIAIEANGRRIGWQNPEFKEHLPVSSEMLERIAQHPDDPIAAINAVAYAVVALESRLPAGMGVPRRAHTDAED